MCRILLLFGLCSLLSPLSFPKDKPVLPAYVLRAQTVLVVIEPGAGEPLTSPGANNNSREDVERAIMKWGRFHLVMDSQTADLMIAVRKGTGHTVTPTVSGGRVDDRPVILQPGQGGDIRLGGHTGRPPGSPSQDQSPQVQTEVGPSDDMLAVYRGQVEHPLDSSPIWRYVAKDALRPPLVRGVDEFRKALIEAEKSANQKQQKKNP
jgi:hypothetical protein